MCQIRLPEEAEMVQLRASPLRLDFTPDPDISYSFGLLHLCAFIHPDPIDNL